MPQDTRRAFLAALDDVSPILRLAFEEAIADTANAARAQVIVEALERGDIDFAVQVLVRPEYFAPLDRALGDAFYQGGVYQLATLPPRRLMQPNGGTLLLRFDPGMPDAARIVRTMGARLVRELQEEMREAIRVTAREGLDAGRGPRSVARDILGAKVGNGRQGGTLGLTANQAANVARARAELQDPEKMGRFLDRKLRDRRFDGMIKKAMREGRPLAASDVDRIAGRYAERALKLRSETIARTEALGAMNAGRQEAIAQKVADGSIPAGAVTKIWRSTPSSRTRDTHSAMDGQEVAFTAPFVSPSGARMMYPGDRSLGAPASEIVACRCAHQVRVDYVAMAR